jgi:hypothetical protein
MFNLNFVLFFFFRLSCLTLGALLARDTSSHALQSSPELDTTSCLFAERKQTNVTQ